MQLYTYVAQNMYRTTNYIPVHTYCTNVFTDYFFKLVSCYVHNYVCNNVHNNICNYKLFFQSYVDHNRNYAIITNIIITITL